MLKQIKDTLVFLIPLGIIIVFLFFSLQPKPKVDTGPSNFNHRDPSWEPQTGKRYFDVSTMDPDNILDPNDL